ncbi:phosphate/phosphite/phosphonate ABC transporter substrate-binding protein [Novilysobacter spongiicola]|uniref:Phosphonate transport system substrate-binding protein n=1 Tax=Lysobacter spongiicola DSM 21749 TaxID=1122188 RepID=A0A1T4N6F4_9GAMM|nr:phosphate/phosphite/phosphonate ABC transporter substrate-binding protein [Lysobacter spongiicola]SJZ74676.1 phosphonate transport system substrate-binding protein [Lysobacter spongiicola DSM 21749]
MLPSLPRLVFALVVGLSLAVPRAVAGPADGVLVLGRISDDPVAHYDQLKPLLDYVVPRMAGTGITEGRVLMAPDARQMASYMRRGQVDWVTETAGSGMLLSDRAGAEPLVLTERDGRSHYKSVFFARRDSGITSLDQLQGRTVAFQRPSSTSAYFVPAGELLGRGYTLEILLSPTDALRGDEVGYLFARSELNISTWVHKELVDVGVMSDVDWANPARMPPAFKPDLAIIGRSDDYPRAVEMVRPDLDGPVRERLRQVLMEAAGDPAAADALRQFFGTTRFLPMDATSRDALQGIRSGVRRVRSEVE